MTYTTIIFENNSSFTKIELAKQLISKNMCKWKNIDIYNEGQEIDLEFNLYGLPSSLDIEIKTILTSEVISWNSFLKNEEEREDFIQKTLQFMHDFQFKGGFVVMSEGCGEYDNYIEGDMSYQELLNCYPKLSVKERGVIDNEEVMFVFE